MAKRLSNEERLVVLNAFTSLVRTDYISLDDADKLRALGNYYVDFFNNLPLLLQTQDHIVTGRRGTGKTTLLYRGYVECLNSWDETMNHSDSKTTLLERVLPVYIDLNQCLSIAADDLREAELESAFLNELLASLTDQVSRFWPRTVGVAAALNTSDRRIRETIDSLGAMLVEGKPVFTKHRKIDREVENRKSRKHDLSIAEAKVTANAGTASESQRRETISYESTTVLTASDFIGGLRQLKQAAGLSAIIVFIDEFSSLNRLNQRRISKILKSLLGNKSGIYFKVSAITDNYDVGDVLIPRDLAPISLDVDSMLENADSLPEGMRLLREMVSSILRIRLESFLGDSVTPEDIFQDSEGAFEDLSRSAMGVTRTIGFALQKAWQNAMLKENTLMTRVEVLNGIRSVGIMYLDTFLGSVKGGALPPYQGSIWHNLINRAQHERQKVPDKSAGHFHVLPSREKNLAKASENFIVHLIIKARTTKKDKTIRHLYFFDYGLTNEYSLGYTTDRNVIRQERFIYDNELEPFDKEFDIRNETLYVCRRCQVSYTQDQLFLTQLGILLDHCPQCNMELEERKPETHDFEYTEEEQKIIGVIYASSSDAGVFAKNIVEEVGCTVQKVSKFGEKLLRQGRILRELDVAEGKHRYRPAGAAQK